MKLSDLAHRAGIALHDGEGDPDIAALCDDSRKVRAGDLFVAMPSKNTDTNSLIPQSVRSGAVAALVSNDLGLDQARTAGIPALLVPELAENNFARLSIMARESVGDPSQKLRLFAITGTNGKTTVAWLLRQALKNLGRSGAYLGTLGYQGRGDLEFLGNTTPFPVEYWNILNRAVNEEMDDFVEEVSSHSLDQGRIAGTSVRCRAFTNLSQDHLDYHLDLASYGGAKRKLFTDYAGGDQSCISVINADDSFGRELVSFTSGEVLTYGFDAGDIRGELELVEIDRLKLGVEFKDDKRSISAPIGGTFNASNCLTVVSMLLAVGYSLAEIEAAMSDLHSAPGRFEVVGAKGGVTAIVDYAHTPDALEKLLNAVKGLNPNRILCLFGCGGDRDPGKRPLMGAAVARVADLAVVTSDNPRTEDPNAIIEQVLKGIPAGTNVVVESDRRKAIEETIAQAVPGDCVVIAGKGHEDYQILGLTKIHFDDREIAREALERR